MAGSLRLVHWHGLLDIPTIVELPMPTAPEHAPMTVDELCSVLFRLSSEGFGDCPIMWSTRDGEPVPVRLVESVAALGAEVLLRP